MDSHERSHNSDSHRMCNKRQHRSELQFECQQSSATSSRVEPTTDGTKRINRRMADIKRTSLTTANLQFSASRSRSRSRVTAHHQSSSWQQNTAVSHPTTFSQISTTAITLNSPIEHSTEVVRASRAGSIVLRTCERCDRDCSSTRNFWLLPFCDQCAPTIFQFQVADGNVSHWTDIATNIRLNLISDATRLKYEAIITKHEWPIQSTLHVLSIMQSSAKSKAMVKQTLAAARKLYTTRRWDARLLDDPLVKCLIQAELRKPLGICQQPKVTQVFNKQEILMMFDVLTPVFSPLYARDAAILAVQLFGVRRASEVLTLHTSDINEQQGNFQVRIRRSKTDQRGEGHFFTLPHKTALQIDPTKVLLHYLASRPKVKANREEFLFTTYSQYGKVFTHYPLTVKAWNARLTAIQQAAHLIIRSSHALRATAISLSLTCDVHTVAQVGGWKSLTYLTTYQRASTDARTKALSRIGAKSHNPRRRTSDNPTSSENEDSS